jgi:hypothetical protein
MPSVIHQPVVTRMRIPARFDDPSYSTRSLARIARSGAVCTKGSASSNNACGKLPSKGFRCETGQGTSDQFPRLRNRDLGCQAADRIRRLSVVAPLLDGRALSFKVDGGWLMSAWLGQRHMLYRRGAELVLWRRQLCWRRGSCLNGMAARRSR